ncbi:cytochrome c [Rhizobium lusitanum]|uniref:Mono/diheme cytochrome c family protein n=1 Tax=Rhizobium lusitanum TaxID=293958 RepID=A0A7X0ITM9_9HYPH|nr:cytochrome c [Rhizobium lusitanum]MBB6486949.1 mono/diheme cytochrome c family protein [Rhizobium lusitanum]
MMAENGLIAAALAIVLCMQSASFADGGNGEQIFLSRCAVSHGTDMKGMSPWADKSNPPTPNLTTPEFKKRLRDYPGVIVSSVIHRPNSDLIRETLQKNGVKLPPFTWTVKDFRDLNEYLTDKIAKTK